MSGNPGLGFLIFGLIGSLMYYSAMHPVYEKDYGTESGRKKCWRASIGFGIVIGIAAAVMIA